MVLYKLIRAFTNIIVANAHNKQEIINNIDTNSKPILNSTLNSNELYLKNITEFKIGLDKILEKLDESKIIFKNVDYNNKLRFWKH